MPEDYGIGYIWDPANGEVPYIRRDYPLYQSGTNPHMYDAYNRWLNAPVYADTSLTDPAVVTAGMPAKFNGDQGAARRYAEGYRWGRENVVQPREKAAPYVAAGLGATFAAPFALDAAATGLASAAADPLWRAAAKRMAIDLPAFESIDRLPQAWGDERLTQQGTNLIKQTTPIGRYAPWAVDVAGPFIAGMVPGMAGDVMMRGLSSGAVGKLASGIKMPRSLNKRISRFKDLYKKGRYDLAYDPEYNSGVSELRRNAISRNTTYSPTITDEALIGEAADRAIQHGARPGSQAAADLYWDTTDLNLIKLMDDYPEFGEFIAENPQLNPVSQEAVDAFARRQASAIRGVAVDAGDESAVRTYLSEPGFTRTGGDRLGSSGGVYTSNSRSIGERFMHPQYGKNDGVLGTLAFPIKYDRTLPLAEQLAQIRGGFFNYDDVLSGVGRYGVSHNMISDAAKRVGFTAGESMYTNRNGARLPAFERVSLLDSPLEIQQKEVFPGLRNAHGRWAATGVQVHPDDSRLFIPHQTSDVDKARLMELIREIKTPSTDFGAVNAVESDYIARAQKAADLVKKSVPYWIGKNADDLNIAAIPTAGFGLIGLGLGLGLHHQNLREKYDYYGEKKRKALSDFYGVSYPPLKPDGTVDVERALDMDRNREFNDYYNSLFREWKKNRKKDTGKSATAQSFAEGGLVSRLQKHYGSNDKVLEAVRKMRAGGPEGEGDVGFVGPPVPYSLVTAGDIPMPEYDIFNDASSYNRRDAHLKSLDAFIKANPTVSGLNTVDFRDVLSAFAGLESSYKKDAANKSGYSGYYGLKGGSALAEDAQHRKAYEHLANLFKHSITRDDIQKGIDMGYTPAQILYKYWNQGNNATEFLQNGSAATIGNNPGLDIMGNNISAIADYYKYIPDAVMDDFHVVKSGDNFSTIQERVRKPGRHYNQAGKDLKQWNTDDIVNGKLRIGDKVWFTTPYEDGGLLLTDYRSGGNLFWPGGLKDVLIKNWYNKNVQPKIDELGINEVRKRLYDNINPYGYHDAKYRVKKALDNEKTFDNAFADLLRDDMWATYLSIPKEQRHVSAVKVVPSQYSPSIGDDGNSLYFKPDFILQPWKDRMIDEVVGGGKEKPMKIGESKLSRSFSDYFGDHTISRGFDPKRGEYASYYDLWDIAPVGNGGRDQSQGIGTPIHFYDRIYLDDYYGIKPDIDADSYYGGYLQPATVTAIKAAGGKIHIKPENRGKFTALKKRTGHSASWFKAHGTPAQKKMAVFALNAKKWKHGDGGIIDRLNQHTGGDTAKMLELIRTARKG